MDHIARQKRLLKIMEAESLDALLVRKKQNISYLTGIKGEDAILFVSHQKTFLVAGRMYREEYARSSKNYTFKAIDDIGLSASIDKISNETRSARIGFESNTFSYSGYLDLKKSLKKKALVPVNALVENLRAIKDAREIKYIRKACEDASGVMEYAFKAVGISTKERFAKNAIEAYMTKKGLIKASFDIIVASGKNASMPHATASRKNIRKGEMVIIDLGTMNYDYNSDLTRTHFLGRIDREYLRVYNIVLDAQKKAIESIKPGIEAKYIDNISRQYISDKGFGRYFIHSLGHGIGLETHEKPHISKNSMDILEENMTMTVEPGVYIPGWGGVRIEDVVLITKHRCEVLTEGCRK